MSVEASKRACQVSLKNDALLQMIFSGKKHFLSEQEGGSRFFVEEDLLFSPLLHKDEGTPSFGRKDISSFSEDLFDDLNYAPKRAGALVV